ncbi:MAG: methyl-accepting chemotaxis protein [Lachnospiraceae bacterium]
MNEKQYQRANKFIFPIMMVLYVYILLTLVLYAKFDTASVGVYIQIASTVFCILLAIYGYAKHRTNTYGATAILLGAAVEYAVLMIFGNTFETFVYMFPIVVCSMAFVKVKVIVLGDTIAFVSFAIHMGRLVSSGVLSPEAVVIDFLAVALSIAASVAVCSVQAKTNAENIAVVTDAANEQKKSMEKLVETANQLLQQLQIAETQVQTMEGVVENNTSSMGEIADSTESTAEAIQKQAQMCETIRDNVIETEKYTEKMEESSIRTRDTMQQSVKAITDLKQQADEVAQAGEITAQASELLSEKVEGVSSFVGEILSISNQTNLLALNASIEAARAGEAGKGFAVVADEIRELSEQTKEASTKITEIISELVQEVERAKSSTQKAHSAIEKQNESITQTRETFDVMEQEVGELITGINQTEESIRPILQATEVITDNISQLSSSSEEVAALSSAGVQTAKQAETAMHDLSRVLKEIQNVAQGLKTSE